MVLLSFFNQSSRKRTFSTIGTRKKNHFRAWPIFLSTGDSCEDVLLAWKLCAAMRAKQLRSWHQTQPIVSYFGHCRQNTAVWSSATQHSRLHRSKCQFFYRRQPPKVSAFSSTEASCHSPGSANRPRDYSAGHPGSRREPVKLCAAWLWPPGRAQRPARPRGRRTARGSRGDWPDLAPCAHRRRPRGGLGHYRVFFLRIPWTRSQCCWSIPSTTSSEKCVVRSTANLSSANV